VRQKHRTGMTRIIIIFLALAFVFGLQLSCSQRNEVDERINVMSPDVGGNLVFFFKKGTTSDEIFQFGRTVTGIPNPNNNTGFSDLPGIMTGVRIIVSGFEGESINFKPNATEEQKAFIKRRISESPLIYKVYENVVPNLIKDL
jgi:hypothetical protein